MLISQRVVSRRWLFFFAHIIRLLLHLCFLFHLSYSCTLHVFVSAVLVSLAHPLLIRHVWKASCLMHELVCVLRISSQLSHFVGFIQLFVKQPFFHVLNSRVVHLFLLFCKLEQLLPHFSLVLFHQLLFESLLSVFLPHPLLEIRCIFVGMNTATRCLLVSVRFKEGYFWAIRNRTFVWKSFKQNIRSRVLNILVLLLLRLIHIDKIVHVLISQLVCLLQLIVENFRMINTKPAILSSHPHDFVNQV